MHKKNSSVSEPEARQVNIDDGDDIITQDIAGEKADIQPKPFYKMPKFIIGVVVAVAVLAAIIAFAVSTSNSDNGEKSAAKSDAIDVVKNDDGKNALKIGNTEISVGMYNCYYSQVVNQYLYYADKGYYTIDTTKDYSQQKTTDSNGNETTWADLFVQDTITQLKRTVALYEAAQKAGLTITDSQQELIDQTLADIKSAAEQENVDLSSYIQTNYGDECTYSILNEVYKQNYLAESYYERLVINTSSTDDEIEKYFASHKDDCTGVDLSYIQINYDSDSTDAEKSAKQCIEKINSQKSLDSKKSELKSLIPDVCSESIENYVSSGYFETEDDAKQYIVNSSDTSLKKTDTTLVSDGVNWLFSSDTAVGACKYFVDKDNSAVLVILKTGKAQILNDTVYSVRHILFKAESDDDSTAVTKKAIKAAENRANSVLSQYESTDKSELSFAILADENSDDEKTISSGSYGVFGGLLGGIKKGEYPSEFDEWVTDSSRKKGDVAKVYVKNSYTGYHLIYFIGSQKEYQFICADALNNEKVTSKMNELVDGAKTIKYQNGMDNTQTAKPEATTAATQSTTDNNAN